MTAQPDPRPGDRESPALSTPPAEEPPSGNAPTTAPDLGTLVETPIAPPGYEVLQLLGRGGMGVVYKARQLKANRLVALKMLLNVESAAAEDRERFRVEAEAVGRLQHPNIVQIYEVGEDRGRPFFSLEYVDGGTLAARLGTGPLPPREAATLAETLARAMHAAHQAGIVHRDLKPANVLVSGGVVSGEWSQAQTTHHSPLTTHQIKITDFGLAKRLDMPAAQTQAGAVLGTPSYMAPEQARGDRSFVGPAADVYALGAILYEMLTGRPPFRADTPLHTLLQVIEDEPVPPRSLQPRLPPDLDTICLRCLRKDPARRYATAAALGDDLARFLRGEPVQARPVGPFERAWKWARRRPAVAALGLVTLLAAVTLVAGDLYFTHELHRQRDLAVREKLAADEQRQRAETNEAQAVRARVEKEHELGRSRRAIFTGALWRVAGLWERDPMLGREILEDPEQCPLDLRDFAWRYYARLCQCERDTFAGHVGDVQALAVSPDGRLLASAGADRVVKLWDLAARKELHTLRGHRAAVRAVAFSPDGKLLVSGGGPGHGDDPSLLATWNEAEIRLWDTATGSERATLTGQVGTLLALAFSPDGKTLATASGTYDGSGREPSRRWVRGDVRLWDVATRQGRSIFAPQDAAVHTLAWSPDGKQLAAGMTHGSHTALIDVSSGAVLARLAGGARSLAWSSDGSTLVEGATDHTVRLWGMREHVVDRLPRQVCRGHSDMVHAVAFAPDGTRIASTSADNSVRVWDAATGQELLVLRVGQMGGVREAHGIAFTADSRALLVGGSGVVRLLDVTPITPEAFTLRGGLAMAVSPDGRTVATASYREAGKEVIGEICLVELEQRERPAQVLRTPGSPDHDSRITALAFTPDGRRLASGGVGGRILFWECAAAVRDAQPGTLFATAGGPICALAFSPDGSRLVAGLAATAEKGAGSLHLWDVARQAELPVPAGLRHDVLCVAFSPDGKLLAAGGRDKVVHVWELDGCKERFALQGHGTVTGVAFSPDGGTLASAGWEGAVRLWDTAAGKLRATLQGHSGSYHAVAFSPDGQSLAVGSGDGTVRIWDVVAGHERAGLPGHSREVCDLAFTPDGRRLVTASSGRHAGSPAPGGEVKVWDVLDTPVRATLAGHHAPIWNVSVTENGAKLASFSRDGTVRLWDLATGRTQVVLTQQSVGGLPLALTGDGKRAVVYGRDQRLHVRNLEGLRNDIVLEGEVGEVWVLALSAAGTHLAAAAGRRSVKVWDLASGRLRGTFTPPDGTIEALALSPDGKTIALGGDARVVTMWDVLTGKQLFTLAGHTAAVRNVEFSPDGKMLATSSDDQTVRVYHTATGTETALLRGHAGAVTTLAFAHDGRTLATGSTRGSGDGEVKLWDVAAGRERACFPGHLGAVSALLFLPGDSVLAIAVSDRRPMVLLWNLPRLH